MSEHLPTVLELFERFHPKYRYVDLIPHDLCLGSHWSHAGESLNFFYLKLGRDGRPFTMNLWPLLDLRAAGVKFEFRFDGTTEPESLWDDLNRIVGKAVHEQVLKGRRFTIRPDRPDAVFDMAQPAYAVLEVEGEPIPGLDCKLKNISAYWDTFVPRESLEGKAIEARLTLAHHQRRLESTKDPRPDITAATAVFTESLRLAAA